MSRVRTVRLGPEDADQRLDRWFKRHYPQIGFGLLARLLRTGQIRVDGARAKPSTRLKAGQELRLPPQIEDAPEPVADGAPRVSAADAEELRARVLYRDDGVLAIDKPAGLAVQGGSGQKRHLDAMLAALCFEKDEPPRLVHRLDKDTSGVLLLARDAATAKALTAAFKGKDVRKLYWAAVAGAPKPPRGRIDLPLAKLPAREGERMGVDRQSGQRAETLYRTLAARGRRAAWLALMPLTGRTHQLRAHLSAIGHPILGDGKYGGDKAHPGDLGALPGRLLLHARELALAHPEDGTTLRITAPLPEHMRAAWQALGFDPAAGEGVWPDEDA